MKRLLVFVLTLALLPSVTGCFAQKTLAFSLYSTSDLRRDTETPDLAPKIEGWYRYAEDFMGMKIEIDQEILLLDGIEQRSKEYILQNDLADVFLMMDSSRDHYNLKELARQGKIINLLDYKEHMPHFSMALNENMNFERVSVDNKIYGFSSAIYNPAHISMYSWIYNYTVFRENGLSVPRNLDELYDCAKKLKQAYPDSYPISFYSSDLLYICNIFGALNRLRMTTHYDGSGYRFGLFDNPDGWKNTIAYMNRLYREGLIAPRFNAYSTEHAEYAAANKKTFIIPNTWSGRAGELSNSSAYEWVCGNTPNGLGNQEPFFSAELRGTTLDPSWTMCVSSEAQDPALLVKLIDNEYARATMDLYNWGEEDALYTVDGNGEKHMIAKTAEEYTLMKKEHPPMAALRWCQDRGSQMAENALLNPVSTVFNDVYEKMDYWQFSRKYIRPDNVRPDDSAAARCVVSSFTQEQSEQTNRFLGPLESYIMTHIRKFITGETALSGWEAFIEQAKKRGDYQEALKIYTDQLKLFE